MTCPYCNSDKPLRTVRTIQRQSWTVRYHKCQECGSRLRSVQYLDLKINPQNKTSTLTEHVKRMKRCSDASKKSWRSRKRQESAIQL
jgi:hypothetical protein